MSVTKPFHDARKLLGVEADSDASAIRRAWRKAVAASPPDRDPDGFRKAREAYELLSDPINRAEQLLSRPVPYLPPPSLPELPQPAPPHALAVELLRAILGRLPVTDLRRPPKTARGGPPTARQS